MTDNKQYPPLPPWASRYVIPENDDLTGNQFLDDFAHAYVDADRAMRAQAAPAAGARPSITPTEQVTIHTLISLARLTYLALDDSEEFVDDDGRCHRISGQAFDDVEATLETLDELPDDKPGVTLLPGGKAWWALRGLLNPVAQAAPQQAAPASQDATDEARYRLLRKKVAIVGDSFHILNIRPTFVAPDPAVELDAVLDAAMAGETK